MRIRTLSMVAAAVALGVATHPLRAQTAMSDPVTINAVVPITGYIEVDATSVTLPSITAADFRAGHSGTASLGIRYGSNGGITIGYELDSYLVGQVSGATLGAHRLEIQAPSGSFEPMEFSKPSWRSGIAAGDYTETVQFRLALPSWTTPADEYSTSVRFLLTAS